MTNRVNALTVVLTEDVREDDVEVIVNAILALRNVSTVTTNVSDITDHVAYSRARTHLTESLLEALRTTP